MFFLDVWYLFFHNGSNPFKMKPNRYEMSYFAGYKVYFYIFYFFCKICICIFFSLTSYMELIYHTSTTNYSYRQTKLMTYKQITQSLYSQINTRCAIKHVYTLAIFTILFTVVLCMHVGILVL